MTVPPYLIGRNRAGGSADEHTESTCGKVCGGRVGTNKHLLTERREKKTDRHVGLIIEAQTSRPHQNPLMEISINLKLLIVEPFP